MFSSPKLYVYNNEVQIQVCLTISPNSVIFIDSIFYPMICTFPLCYSQELSGTAAYMIMVGVLLQQVI